MKHLLSLFLSFVFFSYSLTAADKPYNWEPEFVKVERDYIKGDYKFALRKASALLKKIESKYGNNHLMRSRALAVVARISERAGNYSDYKTNVDLSINILTLSAKEDALAHVIALREISYAYSEFGDYYNAEVYLDKAMQVMNEAKLTDPLVAHEIQAKLALVYYNQGRLLKAESMMPELIKFRLGRVVKKEPYLDEKNRHKERKLSKTEIRGRKRDVADLMNMYSLIVLENGNLPKADSLLVENSGYIKKNLGKKDVSFLENLFQNGLYMELIAVRPTESNLKFEKAAKLSSKTKGVRLKTISHQSLRIQEKLITSHWVAKRQPQSRKRSNIYETRILRYYTKNSPYYGRFLLTDAEVYLLDGDYKRAEDRAMQVINNPVYGPNETQLRIKALELLYQACLASNQFARAEGALEQIVEIRKSLHGEKAPVYHMALLDLANFQTQNSSKFKKAEDTYDVSLKKIDNEIDHRHINYLNYLYNYSSLFAYTDRFDKSLDVLIKAVEDAKKYYGDRHPKYALALERLANIYIDLGKYSEAEKNLAIANEIFKAEGSSQDNLEYSEALQTYARLYIIQGQYEEARKFLKRSMNKQSKGDLKTSGVFEEYATYLIETENFQEVEENLLETIKLREAKYGASHRTLVTPLNQLSNLYNKTGEYVEAEKAAKRAANMSIQIFGESSLKFAESLKQLANAYKGIGDYTKAEDVISKALRIQKAQYGNDHIQVAITLNDMAMIKFYNNAKREEVEGLLNEALAIAKKRMGEDHPLYASILVTLSEFYYELGELEKAEPLLDKANKVWIAKFGETNQHTAQIYFLKGNLAYKKGKYEEAKNYYISSKSIYSKVFSITNPGYLTALSKEGQMNYILGDFKTSVKCLDETTNTYLTFIKKNFPSLSENQKQKYWATIQEDFEFYNTLAVKLKDQSPELMINVYNNALATKGLLLNSSIKVRQRILQSKDAVLIQKYEQWVSRKELLAAAISMTAEQQKENQIDVKLLETEIEELEKELSNRSEDFAKSFRKKEGLDWKDVRKNLLPNEVAVEIIRFRWFEKDFSDTMYIAAIISPETKSYPEAVLFKDGKFMEEKYMKYYRNSMKYTIDDKLSYTRYWKPIKDKIKDNAVVYFSADGVYNQLNLETLTGEDNQYVIDKNEIVLVSNTRDLIERKPVAEKSKATAVVKAIRNKVALFGNPTYYSGELQIVEESTALDSLLTRGKGDGRKKVEQLPGAEQEVKDLNDLLTKNGWKSEAYLKENATEAKIKSLDSVGVFHIATHGFFMEGQADLDVDGLNKNKAMEIPMLMSGLVLKDGGRLLDQANASAFNSSDGILTAYEAMNLNFDVCELVVLSACETGLGEVQQGEGVFGLQRAFLVAGAKTVVMSLFKVNDAVTQELMTSFYNKWIESGNKRKSFIEAKKEIKNKYNKPIYWGAFIMVGLE